MDFVCHRILRRILNHECSESDDSSYYGEGSAYEDSSSEDEDAEILEPLVVEAIRRHHELYEVAGHLKKCSINVVDSCFNSCLHVAVTVCPYDMDVIKGLLELGVEVNARNWKGNTALHAASENPDCDVDLIKVLLEHAANPNAKNIHGDTPLHLFVIKCLYEPSNNRNLEIIKILLDYNANPRIRNDVSINPFLLAVHPPYCLLNAQVGLVKYAADFSVTMSNESLLEKPLLPVSPRSLDLVKLFLQHKPTLVHSRDKRHRTPLHIAVLGGAHVDVVKALIHSGANVKARDLQYNTPLHQTTLCSYDVIETLVKHGAEINAKNYSDNTPLLEAIHNRLNVINPAAIAAFIELGADLEIRDRNFKTALDHAMANSSVPLEVVRLLIEKVDAHFVCGPKDALKKCNFIDNRSAALLYLQYYLFAKICNKYIIEDDPESFISFEEYGPAMCNFLSNFRNMCLSELLHMKYDHLSDGSTNVYCYVNRNIGVLGRRYRFPVIFVKEIIARIHSNKYPHCNDILRASLKRHRLLSYLPMVIVYASSQKKAKTKSQIILNQYATEHLAKFLERETLLSFIEAFSGCCKRRRKQITPPCPNVFKSPYKRKRAM